MYRLFNACVEVLLDSFCYHTTKNIEKFIDQEGKENTNPISSPILIAICIHISPIKFLENKTPNIKFATDDIMCKR